jgi:squalene monooxygenase
MTSLPTQNEYDIIVVGAGIAGSALAYALYTASAQPPPSTSTSKSKPLRIALLERSLATPDRIVGELLQPGGVHALRSLGLTACLEGIDAVPVKGYCVVDAKSQRQVHIPYPEGGRREGGRRSGCY